MLKSMSSVVDLGKIKPHKGNFDYNRKTSKLKDWTKMTWDHTLQESLQSIVTAEWDLRDVVMNWAHFSFHSASSSFILVPRV